MDWDNDGNKDLVLGGYYGYLKVYLNTGTDDAPVFDGFTYVEVNASRFDCGGYSTPDVVDWNNDGKKDLLCGEQDGVVNLLLNTGTDDTPQFAAQTLIQDSGANLDAGSYSHPVAFDWDRDGKTDLLIGDSGGQVKFYHNVGTDAAPAFSGSELLVAGAGTTIDVGTYSRPEIADWNDDGYEDLLVGAYDGFVRVYDAIPILDLAIPAATAEGAGVLTGQGTVAIEAPLTSNLVVTLTSEDTTEIVVPPSVTITLGSTNASFDIAVADDSTLDGSQQVTITASCPGLGTHKQRITVDDNESTALTVALPESVAEGDGVLEGQGTVSVPVPPDDDVRVTFLAGDPSEITAASTTIAAGQTSAPFDLTVVDDNEIDGTQIASITAHVENWTDGMDTVSVTDNEDTNLVVNVPALVGEGDGVLADAGTVSISGTLPGDLVVSLASDDTTELTVPATVTINAGSTSASFDLTVVDDPDSDGRQTVTLTASNAGFVAGNGTATVADNELDRFTLGSVGSPQTAGVAFNLSVTAVDTNGDLAWYQGTASLTAAGDSGGAAVQPSSTTFVDGQWSGPVQIDTVDTGLTLHFTDGSGHEGTSTTFSTVPGPLASFRWNTIPSPRYADVPFPVTVSARDANGFLVTGFAGIVDLAALIGHHTPEIGSGSSPWDYPLSTFYHDARTQVIYLSSELGGPGRITSLALDVTQIPGQVMNSWTIRMKHTSLDAYAASPAWEGNGWTTVYQANQDRGSTGWVLFEFSTPFDYDGTSNLMIDFSFNNSSYTTSGYSRYSTAAANRTLYYRTDSNFGDPLSWSGTESPSPTATTQVPNIKLGMGSPATITPVESGAFANGVWTGIVSVLESGTNVSLQASQGAVKGNSATFDLHPSDIRILGNGVPIGVGDMTPATAVGTDFGTIVGSITHVFTITNQSASATITLTDTPRVTVTDPASRFTLSQDATTGAIAPGNTTPFEITYNPLSTGMHSATVTVVNTSAAVPVYTFAIKGACVVPPTVDTEGATPVDATSATLAAVLNTGVVATAWMCWGTTDGGTASTGDWDNVTLLGTVTEGSAYSSLASGLETNRTYWYRCYVSSAAGTDWSDTAASFSGTAISDDGTDGGDPVAGAGIYLDASLDDGANATWEDSLGVWDLTVDTSPAVTYIADAGSAFTGITAAYDFPGGTSGNGGGSGTSFGSMGGWDTQPVTIEIWFRPDSTSDDGRTNGQVLWETGGGTGLGIFYNDGTVEVGHDSTEVISSVDVSGVADEFIQVVLTYDETDFRLYVNGSLAGTGSKTDTDWSGTDGAGLGARGGSNVGGRGSGDVNTESFEGQIAIFRAYRNQILDADAVLSNYNAIAVLPYPIVNLAPSDVGCTGATFNACLSAPTTNYDVYVTYTFYDTNGTPSTYSDYVGSWTNVTTNISVETEGLVPDGTYTYSFAVSNASTFASASPDWEFHTLRSGECSATTLHSVPHGWLGTCNSSWSNDYESAAMVDHDGDGVMTWKEYWSGTDPLDDSSYLKLDSVTFDGPNVVITWQHAAIEGPLPDIAIHACTDLCGGAWVNIGAKSPVNGTNTWTVSAGPHTFYRLSTTTAP